MNVPVQLVVDAEEGVVHWFALAVVAHIPDEGLLLSDEAWTAEEVTGDWAFALVDGVGARTEHHSEFIGGHIAHIIFLPMDALVLFLEVATQHLLAVELALGLVQLELCPRTAPQSHARRTTFHRRGT